MARKGRELELLVETLEKIVLPMGATIKSPSFLNDKITSQPREVDILIEHTVGTSNIKIALECRDRQATQDTTWIEQMHGKFSSLDVDKVIAVSSSPFSEPAKIKAKSFGIETRTISEINLEMISDWWLVESIQTYTQSKSFIGATIGLEFPEKFNEAINGKTISEKIFFSTSDNKMFSVIELIPPGQNEFWSKCITNGPPVRTHIKVNFENPQSRFYVKLNDEKCDVLTIIFELDFYVAAKSLPISKITKYEAEDKTISHVIEVDGFDMNGTKTAQIIKTEDGAINLSFRENN